MSEKIKKRKVNKTNVWAIIISLIAIFALICVIVGILLIGTLLKDKPTLDIKDFEQQESSIIFDDQGEEIANLGTVIRQNVEYSELPNCVVDAFVSIEDSRFFEHNGFDIPRFTKALLENIRTMSFEQGGSTFTMQLVKNTYFTNDDTGEQASRSGVSGIRRKVQEIALALELETYEPKQFIFESYLNKLNYGGDRNIRGIQKAAQYYFSKDVCDLNINEAALLAGVINAPNYYNPFWNIEAAQEREEEVLYQMYHHGYISETEYELAKSVKVIDLLADPYAQNKDGEGIPYQAYIDAVVNEVIELTGLDPYSTTMHIYTCMNKEIQSVMDEIQGQTSEDYLAYPDDFVEIASVCINNSTGEVVGILGGRNYAGGGQLLLNHATEQYKQPGSSMKPILDYALAFENLGWATDHVICDEPMYMDSSKLNLVYNFSNTYVGDVTLKEAVGESINTCAIQTLQQVLDKMKYEYVVNYTKSLGYDFSLDSFNVQYAIGGSTCEVTPYQHAAAYAAIMNSGTYNPPHTISRIEFKNGKSPITPVYESTQVISEQAAYLTTELMKSNVNSYGGSYSVVKSKDYQVYGKTGTTDWGIDGKDYGIPSGANKDAWLVAATTEYTTATWVGYEKAVLGQPSYITNDYYYTRPQAKICHLILDACYEHGKNKPSEITRPSGISSITHIIGTWPYASIKVPEAELDEKLITTGLIKSDAVKLVNLEAPTVKYELDKEECSVELVNSSTAKPSLKIKWSEYPKKEDLKEVADIKDTSLKSSSGDIIIPATGKVLFDYSWIYGPIRYCADITIKQDDGQEYETKFLSEEKEDEWMIDTGDLDIDETAKITISLYYGYEKSDISSKKVVLESIPLSDLNRNLTRYNGNDVDYAYQWCNENNVEFNYVIVDNLEDEGFVLSDQYGSTYDDIDKYGGISVPYGTKLIGTYYLYFIPTVDRINNTIFITLNARNYIKNSSKLSWFIPFENMEGYTCTKNGSKVTIVVPNGALSNSYVVDCKYNSTYTYQTSVSIQIN